MITDADARLLFSAATQIPVVLIFVWFVLRILNEFLKFLTEQNKEWKQFIAASIASWSKEQCDRDVQWREFLEREQKRSIEAYHGIATHMQSLVQQIESQQDTLTNHDARVDDLASQVTAFISNYNHDNEKVSRRGG
jgi:hypothetical protein